MKKPLTCFISSVFFLFVYAQKDAEFPRGGVLYLHAQDGMITNFTTAPNLFVAGLGISPQLTIIGGYLRVGGTASVIFNNKKLDGLFGPNLSIKLASLNTSNLGSILNLQLQLEHLLGTSHQKLLGGALQTEIGQLLKIGISMHRDYGLNDWWFQGGIGYNLLHKRKKKLEDPMK